ncbi:MAG: 1-acyl-sn-glycerol-3-phosphate acyltransferase [Candidatus Omnitrophica bacterium]|nr:1-acyl-sn-glycerol-3-phosphate acyltransferase [Candidatus Omnitrophota bacterium]
MLYWFSRAIFTVLFKLFFRIRVLGAENIPAAGPFIVAANHVSYLDPVVVGVASPRRVAFITRGSLFKNRCFGLLIKSVGAFPLSDGEGSNIAAIRKALGILKTNAGLLVFPEGTRSYDGKLRTGLSGVGLIAARAGCPVIPAFVSGTDKALPRGAGFIKIARVSVYFAKAVYPPKSSDKNSYKDFTDRVMREIDVLAAVRARKK